MFSVTAVWNDGTVATMLGGVECKLVEQMLVPRKAPRNGEQAARVVCIVSCDLRDDTAKVYDQNAEAVDWDWMFKLPRCIECRRPVALAEMLDTEGICILCE